MALVCVYVRKANYFQQVFKRHDVGLHHVPTPNIGFSKALSGFLMMMTQNGKLLYISDNAAEYLGHSMEDLLIHGDSVYDIIDKQDHQAIQAELVRSATAPGDDERIFLCRMNVSRNARRQMRFGDQKVVLVQGHYLSFLPLCSRNEPVFLATCTPVAMPETRECVVQGATNVFTSIHSMDMKFMHIDKNGEFHLGYPRSELQGASWYHLLHWDCMREAQSKHRLITQSEQDRSCILLLRLQRRSGDWLWVHCVLQVKDNMENSQQPVIVCTNQVLSEREATVMRANSWLYHYYMVQSKLQYGLAYEAHATASRMAAAAAAAAYYHHPHPPPAPAPPPQQPPPPQQVMSPYDHHHHHHATGAYLHPHHHHHGQMTHHGHHHNGTSSDTTGTASPGFTEAPTYPAGNGGSTNGGGFHRHSGVAGEPEPVDYSLHHDHLPVEEVRTPPVSSSPLKRRHPGGGGGGGGVPRGRKSPRSSSSPPPPSEQLIVDLDRGGGGGGGGTVLVTSSSPLLPSLPPRVLVKAQMAVDPAELMEQWNPSPPWSDTTVQKVPDIVHQDLSPYVTTPPTPTGTPGGTLHHHHISATSSVATAFTFDWAPEQYVPNLQHHSQVRTCEEEHFRLLQPATMAAGAPNAVPIATSTTSWLPTEHQHRLFPLQPPPPPRLVTPNYTQVRLDHPGDVEQPPAKDTRDSGGRL